MFFNEPIVANRFVNTSLQLRTNDKSSPQGHVLRMNIRLKTHTEYVQKEERFESLRSSNTQSLSWYVSGALQWISYLIWHSYLWAISRIWRCTRPARIFSGRWLTLDHFGRYGYGWWGQTIEPRHRFLSHPGWVHFFTMERVTWMMTISWVS